MTTEMEPTNLEKGSRWLLVRGILSKLLAKIDNIAKQTLKIVKDDPRKAIHSLKVGLTLTLVSLFYYIHPLYSSFGVSALWAVMTVVVVFEFYVGATLGKGLNRGMATLLAGALGLGVNHLASATGRTCEPIMIELFVFLQAAVSTFIRFFPQVKARYDYGMLIFILTFSLVTVSGFRTDEILQLARERLSTILIGASTCVIVSVLVSPVWAGEDLHLLVAQNVDQLGDFVEGFADKFFRTLEMTDTANGKSSIIGLNGILDSKSREEMLANFAKWEPGHGKFMYKHPWKQYLKIGKLTRQCACRVEALNTYINSPTQGQREMAGEIQEAFLNLSFESGKVLKELSWEIQTMTRPSSPSPHIASLKLASKNLHSVLELDLGHNLMQVIPIATVASLLLDTAISVENIASAVNELSSLAKFKCNDSNRLNEKEELLNENIRKVNQVPKNDIPHVCVTIDGAAQIEKQDQFSDSGGKRLEYN